MPDNEESPIPDTEAEGQLTPPPRKPPTAIGAETPGPGDDSHNGIVIPAFITVAELARRIHVPIRKVVWVAFRRFGRIVTPNKAIPFQQASDIVTTFGYSARYPAR